MFGNSGDSENSNEPVFVYVNAVTQAERTQLLKDAFNKAVADARETAEIMNGAPGAALNVRISDEVPGNEYAQYQYQMSNGEKAGELIAQLRAENPLAMIGLSTLKVR